MKKVYLILLVVGVLVLGIGCDNANKLVNNNLSVERTVVGKIIAIDTEDKYSALHFDNDLEIIVTNQSLTTFQVSNSFLNVWTYTFHYEGTVMGGYPLYIIVSVSNNIPDYRAK